MTMKVECNCGKKYRVRDDWMGKRVKCPACGAVLRLPDVTREAKTIDEIALEALMDGGETPNTPEKHVVVHSRSHLTSKGMCAPRQSADVTQSRCTSADAPVVDTLSTNSHRRPLVIASLAAGILFTVGAVVCIITLQRPTLPPRADTTVHSLNEDERLPPSENKQPPSRKNTKRENSRPIIRPAVLGFDMFTLGTPDLEMAVLNAILELPRADHAKIRGRTEVFGRMGKEAITPHIDKMREAITVATGQPFSPETLNLAVVMFLAQSDDLWETDVFKPERLNRCCARLRGLTSPVIDSWKLQFQRLGDTHISGQEHVTILRAIGSLIQMDRMFPGDTFSGEDFASLNRRLQSLTPGVVSAFLRDYPSNHRIQAVMMLIQDDRLFADDQYQGTAFGEPTAR